MTQPLIIVGAGAAGLALGHHLSRRGRAFLILERGRVGESWRTMPADTRLLSPWWANVLPGTRVPLARAWRRVPAQEYAEYLAGYAVSRKLRVEEGCEVRRVRATSGGFTLDTSSGQVEAAHLVCASGYFQNPHVPALPGGDDGSVPGLHAAGYEGAAALRRAHPGVRRVLVVGRRITAGQIMVELHEAGFTVALSARGPVRMRAPWRRLRLKEELYFFYERAFVRLFPEVKAEEKPIMDGGRTQELLRNGAVEQVDGIRGIAGGHAELLDGRRWACDLVIYATGYRPALRYLDGTVGLDATGRPHLAGMRSAEHARLHFLGLENLRNFLSPYLRGACADAEVLARELTA